VRAYYYTAVIEDQEFVTLRPVLASTVSPRTILDTG
jgi:hypothetical protein